MSANLMVIVGVGGLSIANAWVCVAVLRNAWYSRAQKGLQCSLVWLLPVLGPIIVWGFLRSQSETRPKEDGFISQDDQGISGREFYHPGIPGGGDP